MMITEILPVTKQKYRVVTDEQLAFILYKGELSHYHLQEGRELTEQEFRTIQEEVLIKRAKLRAMHLLTARDYTELQLSRFYIFSVPELRIHRFMPSLLIFGI